MKTFSYAEIGDLTATFEADPNVTEGCVVKISGENKVSACLEGDKFLGVAGKPRDGVVSVQVRGFMEVPYTADIVPGSYGLVANGKGGVRYAANVATTGIPSVVVSVDDIKKTAVIFV